MRRLSLGGGWWQRRPLSVCHAVPASAPAGGGAGGGDGGAAGRLWTGAGRRQSPPAQQGPVAQELRVATGADPARVPAAPQRVHHAREAARGQQAAQKDAEPAQGRYRERTAAQDWGASELTGWRKLGGNSIKQTITTEIRAIFLPVKSILQTTISVKITSLSLEAQHWIEVKSDDR